MMEKYDEKPYNIHLLGDDRTSGKLKLYNHLGGELLSPFITYKDVITNSGAVRLNFWPTYDVDDIGSWKARQSYHKRIFAVAVCFEMRCLASYSEAIDRLKKLNNGGVLNSNTPILLVATPTKQEKVNEEIYYDYEDHLKHINIVESRHKVRFVDCSHDDKTINSQNLVNMISNLIHMEALGNYPSVDFFINDHLSSGKFLQEALIKAQQQYVDNILIDTPWGDRKKGKSQTTDKRKPTDIKSWNGADKLLELLCGEGNDDEESYKFLVCKELFDIDVLFPNAKAATIVQAIKVELLANALIKNDLCSDDNKYSDYFKNKIMPGLSRADLCKVYDLLLIKVTNNEPIDVDRVNFNVYAIAKGHRSETLHLKATKLMKLCNTLQEKKSTASNQPSQDHTDQFENTQNELENLNDVLQDTQSKIKDLNDGVERQSEKNSKFSKGVHELSKIVDNDGDSLSLVKAQQALEQAPQIVEGYMKDDEMPDNSNEKSTPVDESIEETNTIHFSTINELEKFGEVIEKQKIIAQEMKKLAKQAEAGDQQAQNKLDRLQYDIVVSIGRRLEMADNDIEDATDLVEEELVPGEESHTDGLFEECQTKLNKTKDILDIESVKKALSDDPDRLKKVEDGISKLKSIVVGELNKGNTSNTSIISSGVGEPNKDDTPNTSIINSGDDEPNKDGTSNTSISTSGDDEPNKDGTSNTSIITPGFQKLNDDLDKLLNPPTDTKGTSADKQTKLSGCRSVMFAFDTLYQEAGSPKTLKEIDAWTKKCFEDEDEEEMSHTI